MKSTLIASIPALVLIFALTCGFGTFHVMLQQAEASDNCGTLANDCRQAEENESIACASGNVERCESAKASKEQACSKYSNTCE